ncbi:hypothetical protein V1477_010765 [Vespula maculifrons]|uniref:Uncharacterized protein n=1 Tax=Vespula maculifrons TaxID=7453 RepID=A0ABD2C2W3_VESMC
MVTLAQAIKFQTSTRDYRGILFQSRILKTKREGKVGAANFLISSIYERFVKELVYLHAKPHEETTIGFYVRHPFPRHVSPRVGDLRSELRFAGNKGANLGKLLRDERKKKKQNKTFRKCHPRNVWMPLGRKDFEVTQPVIWSEGTLERSKGVETTEGRLKTIKYQRGLIADRSAPCLRDFRNLIKSRHRFALGNEAIRVTRANSRETITIRAPELATIGETRSSQSRKQKFDWITNTTSDALSHTIRARPLTNLFSCSSCLAPSTSFPVSFHCPLSSNVCSTLRREYDSDDVDDDDDGDDGEDDGEEDPQREGVVGRLGGWRVGVGRPRVSLRPFSPAGKGHRPEYWDPSGGGKSGKGRALGPREAGGYDGAGGEEAPRPPNTTSLLKERERRFSINFRRCCFNGEIIMDDRSYRTPYSPSLMIQDEMVKRGREAPGIKTKGMIVLIFPVDVLLSFLSSAFKWLVYDLPTYHSMLNFDESLWKFVKEKMRKQRTWLET